VLELKVPFANAVCMVSSNPARFSRLDKEVGTLQKGKKADIVVMQEGTLDLLETYVCGKQLYFKK